MLSTTKTRTTIITVVAAFSFGGASLVPAVARAKTNNGKSGTNERAKMKQAIKEHAEMCERTENNFNEYGAKAKAATDPKVAVAWYDSAFQEEEYAKEHGCAWAARVRPPESPTSGITPTIPIPPPAK